MIEKNEGELKKRIIGFNDIVTQECDYSCRLDGKKFPIPDRTQEFIKISNIDEAKKEFPLCNNCEYGGYGCLLKDPDDEAFCPKMEWFLKWFGDKE